MENILKKGPNGLTKDELEQLHSDPEYLAMERAIADAFKISRADVRSAFDSELGPSDEDENEDVFVEQTVAEAYELLLDSAAELAEEFEQLDRISFEDLRMTFGRVPMAQRRALVNGCERLISAIRAAPEEGTP